VTRTPTIWPVYDSGLNLCFKNISNEKRSLASADETPIHLADISSPESASFCESVEAGHSNQGNAAKIAKLLGITNPPVRMDSQCKYCAVARGDADIYLRLPVRKDYEEKIWVSLI
jgi:3'(2'), 5'-bisphosphate nucleotidase